MSDKFEYKYSAPTEEEKKEIESIRNKYTQSYEKNDLTLLRSLDNKVKNIPLIISLAIGLITALIFGLGMTCILKWDKLVIGSIIAIICLLIMILNPFIYKRIFSYMKNKYKEQILELSNKMLNQKDSETK